MCDKEKGYIYIITNPATIGYIKIGYAKDINERLKQFNTSSIRNYEVYAAYEVYSYQVDKQIHGIIELLNPRLHVPNKEFFRMEPEEAYELLERIAKLTSTEDRLFKYENGKPIKKFDKQLVIEEVKDIKKTKRAHFMFSMIGLKQGDIIESNIIKGETATVYDEKNITYRDQIMTTTTAAKIILKIKTGKDQEIQGPACWTYNGKILDQLRKESENNFKKEQ